MIEGKAVKVLKIMVCTESWLDNNYFNPLKGRKIVFKLYTQTILILK